MIVAVAAVDLVVVRLAEQPVLAAVAVEEVPAVAAHDLVVAGAADSVSLRLEQRSLSAPPPSVSSPAPASRSAPVPAGQEVDAGAATASVVAVATIEPIVAGLAVGVAGRFPSPPTSVSLPAPP